MEDVVPTVLRATLEVKEVLGVAKPVIKHPKAAETEDAAAAGALARGPGCPRRRCLVTRCGSGASDISRALAAPRFYNARALCTLCTRNPWYTKGI